MDNLAWIERLKLHVVEFFCMEVMNLRLYQLKGLAVEHYLLVDIDTRFRASVVFGYLFCFSVK